MRGVLNFIAKGRFQAISAATLLAILSPLFAPLYYFSGAVIGLATLRYGVAEGVLVLAGTGVVFATLSGLVFKSLIPAALMLFIAWLPCFLLAMVLRATVSQGVTLSLAALAAVIAVFGFHIVVNDAGGWWYAHLSGLMNEALVEIDRPLDPKLIEQLSQLVEQLSPVMTGLMLAGVLFGAVIMVLVARWWHAILDNPGGFGTEFRALRLDGRIAIAVVGVVAVVAYAQGALSGLGIELLCIGIVLYVFQGLAVAHSFVAHTGAWRGWLVALYVFSVLATPQVMLILALLGLLDAAINFRARFMNRGGPA